MPAAKLTHGLRWRDEGDPTAQYELITDILQGRCADAERSPRTVEAEGGLGIPGQPSYYFVMRTERAFGRAVFVYTDTGTSDRQTSHGGGATAFDSGGLWHCCIRTEPPTGRDERRRLFHAANIPLADWQPAFETYVQVNYARVEEYVAGHGPEVGTPPIVPKSPNRPRAWTWEVRVPRDSVAGCLLLIGGAMRRMDYENYINWLTESSPVEDEEARQIQRWTLENLVLSDNNGVPPSVLVEEALLVGGRDE